MNSTPRLHDHLAAANPAEAAADRSPAPQTRPRLSTRWWGLVIRAVAAFALIAIANALSVTVRGLLTPVLPQESLTQSVFLVVWAGIVLAVVVLGVWAWMRWIERRPLRAAGWRFRASSLGWLGVGVVASFAAMALVLAVGALLLPPPEPEAGVESGALGDLAVMPLWLVVVLVFAKAFVLQGIPEELIYRGWLFDVTRDRPWLTLTWTTLAFTIVHLASSGGQQGALEHVLYLAIPFGFGLLAGSLVLLTGSMWAGAGTHGGFHVATGLAGFVHPAPPTSADWLLIGAVYAVLAAGVLVVWGRRRRRSARASAAVSET